MNIANLTLPFIGILILFCIVFLLGYSLGYKRVNQRYLRALEKQNRERNTSSYLQPNTTNSQSQPVAISSQQVAAQSYEHVPAIEPAQPSRLSSLDRKRGS